MGVFYLLVEANAIVRYASDRPYNTSNVDKVGIICIGLVMTALRPYKNEPTLQ